MDFVMDSTIATNMSAPVGRKLGSAELLFRAAETMGLQPDWITPNGTFAIVLDGRERYINLARSPLNSHTSASLAKDKYVTRRILGRHHFANIPFARCRTIAEAEQFLLTHTKIIAKPVTGSGSRDIHIITTTAQIHELNIRRYILEKYIPGREFRYLILGDNVIGVHRSEYGTSVSEHRALQRISYPPAAWDPALVTSSLRIARILGLKFAAVDYMVDANGQAYILEVNSTPGLKWFHAPTRGPAVDVASQFLNAICQQAQAAA